MRSSYNVSWKLCGRQDLLLTYLSFSPDGRRLASASEDRNLLLIDAERGDALVQLDFEGQTSVHCGLWSSNDNIVVGCCNGYMYEVCFNPTNKQYRVTMLPMLHRMPNQVRSIAFDPARRLLAVAHGNLVALYTQNTSLSQNLPSEWEFLEDIKAPSSGVGSLIQGIFFYLTTEGTSNLFIAYAELGWKIWRCAATVTWVSPDTSRNVCRIGRVSLAEDQKSVVISTLDHSIVVYALGSDGPILSSFKEYPYQDIEDMSLVVPVASTLDGSTLGGTTYGNVPMIEGANGEMSIIQHEETDHLIRVLATHGNNVVIGSSSRSGSVLKYYTSSAVARSASNNRPKPLVVVTATEALLGWDALDSQWTPVSWSKRIGWRLQPSRQACIWMLLLTLFLILVLSADPPRESSFQDTTKQSSSTDMFKPTYDRSDYWIMFGVRHFTQLTRYQFKRWLAWTVDSASNCIRNTAGLIPKGGKLVLLGMAEWMCNQVQVYRESG
ncbi:hypothetical protein FRC09_004105, partial [Ceratobasidium sp. 395]